MIHLVKYGAERLIIGKPDGIVDEPEPEPVHDELVDIDAEAAMEYAKTAGLEIVNLPKQPQPVKGLYIYAWYFGRHPDSESEEREWFKGIGFQCLSEINSLISYILQIGKFADDDETKCHFEFDTDSIWPGTIFDPPFDRIRGYLTMSQSGQYEIWAVEPTATPNDE